MRKIYFLLVLVLTPSFAHAQFGFGDPFSQWQMMMMSNMNRWANPISYGPQYGGGYPVMAQSAPCGYTVVELPKQAVSTKTEILKALGSAGVGAMLGYATTGSGQGAARGAAGGGALYGSIELAKRYLRPGQMVVPVPCPPQPVFQTPQQVSDQTGRPAMETKLFQNRFNSSRVKVYNVTDLSEPIAEIGPGEDLAMEVPQRARFIAFALVEDGSGREVWTDKIGKRQLPENSGWVYSNPRRGEF